MSAAPSPSSSSSSERIGLIAVGAFAAGALATVALHVWSGRRNPASRTDAPLAASDPIALVRSLRTMDEAQRLAFGLAEVPVTLRVPTPADVDFLAHQWQESYNSSAAQLHEAPVFPTLASAHAMVSSYVADKVGLLAVQAGKGESGSDGELILASAFNDESDIHEPGGVVGCGPWTVGWGSVAQGVGRTLLGALVEGSLQRGARSLRLLQGATNNASFALYSKLGFEVREPLEFLTGTLRAEEVSRVLALHPRWQLRELSAQKESVADVAAAAALWQAVTGNSRRNTIEHIAADEARRAKKFALFDERGKCMSVNTVAQLHLFPCSHSCEWICRNHLTRFLLLCLFFL
jgi:hypothetical protein